MDYTEVNGDAAVEEAGKDDLFVIGDLSNSDSELEVKFNHQKHRISCKHAARLNRDSSPPLLLAFSVTSGRTLKDGSLSSTSSLEDEDSDQSIEEWMILGSEEQLGDSNIQLNLSCWGSSEDDSEVEDHNGKSVKNPWPVSKKDKYDADQPLPIRYFVPGCTLICNMCNRMGHLARSCYYHKKCPICILCGIQGHIQRDCPSRPCPTCGLPSHGLRPCERAPLWNQRCQRCHMAGHLSDACPDTWRQYHLTIRSEVPLRPCTDHMLNHKKWSAHCYNCSERGHYGYECRKRRMISGTSFSLPYVCHYDTMEDIRQCQRRMQERVKELVSAGSLPDQQPSEPTRESGMENQTFKERGKTRQEAWSRAERKKTWPERRRERRKVKRLRREAQARREGGLLRRSPGNLDDEDLTVDPFRPQLQGHRLSTPSPQKKRRDKEGGTRSKKSREAERWKKRRGIKHGDLYPHSDIDMWSKNLTSPKERVRHRRR